METLTLNIVVASINPLVNFNAFQDMLEKYQCTVIVVDEGNRKIREKNCQILRNINHEFYGPLEREQWFKENFGSNYQKYVSLIPTRCHAETSFGFLAAFQKQPDLVIELDDDTFPILGQDLVKLHHDNLIKDDGRTVRSLGRWYNTVDNLVLNCNMRVFPRGHPYFEEARTEQYLWTEKGGRCVLNMGLWVGQPDLDAVTILHSGGLDGRSVLQATRLRETKIIADRDTYFAICSMNTAFVTKIIPAFYQLYMNFLGIDRFDDIWSGILLKKVVDHLGDNICLGAPTVRHQKRPRDAFSDLKKEIDGMMINEMLSRIVAECDIDGGNYYDAYASLTGAVEARIAKISSNITHSKFLRLQVSKMKKWLEAVDKLI